MPGGHVDAASTTGNDLPSPLAIPMTVVVHDDIIGGGGRKLRLGDLPRTGKRDSKLGGEETELATLLSSE